MRSPFTMLFLLCMGFVSFVMGQDPLKSGTGASRNISIAIRTTFPESQVNTLGMFYNGRTSRVDISIHNNETEPITVHFIGGAFQDIATLKPIHNLTAKEYNAQVQPRAEQIFPFAVQTYFPGPRVLHLSLAVQFSLAGQVYQTVAHNGTVTIADPPQSIFDPQAWFLYIILASIIGGIAYFVYSTWLRTLLPKRKTGRSKDGRRRDAATGASNYEEWIPQHHLKKDTPSAKKRKVKGAASPGNLSN